MNWRTDTVTSTFNTDLGVRNAISNRAAQRGGSTSFSGMGGLMSSVANRVSLVMQKFGLAQGQIVGINIDYVPTMRGAIESYCQEIERYLRTLNPTANLGIAIKSPTVQRAVTNYMDTVVIYCSNLVSQLRAFSDKLADVASKWNQSTENMAGSINATGSNFATGSAYNTAGHIANVAANAMGQVANNIPGSLSSLFGGGSTRSASHASSSFAGSIGSSNHGGVIGNTADLITNTANAWTSQDWAGTWDYSNCDGIFDGVGATIDGLLGTVGNVAKGTLGTLGAGANFVGDTIVDSANTVIDGVGAGINFVGDVAQGTANAVGNFVGDIGDTIAGWFGW